MDSVLTQNLRDFELVVIDDASTDSTRTILDSYTDRRVLRLLNDTPLGLTRSLNRGLDAARGIYVARLDADDLCSADRLERQVAFLDAHAKVGLLGSAFTAIDESGTAIRDYRQPTDDSAIRWQMLFHNAFCHSAVMVRRDLCLAASRYDESLPYSQDYDLWARLLERSKGANLDQSLVKLRVHGNSVSAIRTAEQQEIARWVSRRQICALLGDATPDDVTIARLRDWYYRFPRFASADDLRVASTFTALLDALTNLPMIDPAIIRQLRAKWAVRLLNATPPSLWRHLYTSGILPWILRNAPSALPRFAARKALRRRDRKEEIIL